MHLTCNKNYGVSIPLPAPFLENNMNIKNDIDLDTALEHINDNWYLLDVTDDADSELVTKRDNLLKLIYDVEEYEKKYVFD